MAVLSDARVRPARRKRIFPGAVLSTLLLAAATHLPAQAAPSREYQIKAAFIYNFVQFVAWPATAFPSPDAPLCIGILGDDRFAGTLEAMVQGTAVRHHPLVVRRFLRVEDMGNCQLIFISKSEQGRIAEILPKIDRRPVLTVSETSGFGRLGGIINFYLEGNKVRFEINPAAARRTGLAISSQLLSLGKIVGPDSTNED